MTVHLLSAIRRSIRSLTGRQPSRPGRPRCQVDRGGDAQPKGRHGKLPTSTNRLPTPAHRLRRQPPTADCVRPQSPGSPGKNRGKHLA